MQSVEEHPLSPRHRWTLLICGPLEHPGYVQAGNVEGGLHRKSEFDCTSTIVQNVRDWGRLFDDIKLVTWKNQADLIRPEIKALGIGIEMLDDPGRASSFSGDSRIRVATATAEGARRIADPESYVLRIRSDQRFNLSAMIRSHEQNDDIVRKNQRRSGLSFPHISGLCFWLDRPYSLCNYAHAAKAVDLVQFAEAQIRYRHASSLPHISWPEGDTIRKHLYSLSDRLRVHGYKDYCCFPALPKSLLEGSASAEIQGVPWSVLDLWNFSLRHIYSVATEDALTSLWWKEELYPSPRHFGNGMRFQAHWRRCQKHQCRPIRNYCASKIRSGFTPPWVQLSWYLHGRAEEIQGLVPTRRSQILKAIFPRPLD